MILVGIDPGTCTGIAVWDAKAQQFTRISSGKILDVIDEVRQLWRTTTAAGDALLVVVEDARRRFVFDKADERMERGAGVREGVGSIKRDCAIWEEFLRASGIPFDLRTPRGTKKKAEQFQQLTGYAARTNEHERDAACAVFGLNEPIARGKLLAFHDGAANRVPAAGTRPPSYAHRARSFVRRRNSPA